jgi:hypothetical protein
MEKHSGNPKESLTGVPLPHYARPFVESNTQELIKKNPFSEK